MLWLFCTIALLVIVHECVHYLASLAIGGNPQFIWNNAVLLKNPAVVNYAAGITRWENIVSLGAPLVILNTTTGAVMLSTGGILAGTAAIMFAVNSIASAGDLGNIIRVAKMPAGTKYANFERDGEVRTEYAVPVDRQ